MRGIGFLGFAITTVLHPLLLALAIPAGLLAGTPVRAAVLGALAGVLRIVLHYLLYDTKLTFATMLVTLLGGAGVACATWLIRRRMHG
jgi:hypothetical protein